MTTPCQCSLLVFALQVHDISSAGQKRIKISVKEKGYRIPLPAREMLPGPADSAALGFLTVHLTARKGRGEGVHDESVSFWSASFREDSMNESVGTINVRGSNHKMFFLCRALPRSYAQKTCVDSGVRESRCKRFANHNTSIVLEKGDSFSKIQKAVWYHFPTLSNSSGTHSFGGSGKRSLPFLLLDRLGADSSDDAVTKITIRTSEYFQYSNKRREVFQNISHELDSVLVKVIKAYGGLDHSQCFPGGYPRSSWIELFGPHQSITSTSKAGTAYWIHEGKPCLRVPEILDCLERERARISVTRWPQPTTHLAMKSFASLHMHRNSIPAISTGTWFVYFRCISHDQRFGMFDEGVLEHISDRYDTKLCRNVNVTRVSGKQFTARLATICTLLPFLAYASILAATRYLESFIDAFEHKAFNSSAYSQFMQDGSNHGQHGYSSLIMLCIGYVVPLALQYIVTTWKSMETLGSLDECRYNEDCFLPGHVHMPMNNLWSNAAYIVVGLLFAVKVLQVQYCIRKWDERRRKCLTLLYAMSLGLCAEGVMSALYHSCPNRLVFQFDAYFLFLIPTLGLLALSQCNSLEEIQPDFNEKGGTDVSSPPASIIYFNLFANPIFIFNFAGTWMNGDFKIRRSDEKIVTETTYLLFLLPWLWFMLAAHGNLCYPNFIGQGISWFPGLFGVHQASAGTLLAAWCSRLLVVGATVYVVLKGGDISKFFIGLCVVAMICACVRVILRVMSDHSNCVGHIRLIIFHLVLTLAFGCAAVMYFHVRVSDKAASAGESRNLSGRYGQCVFLDAFDAHDLWHALGALGLGCWMLFVLDCSTLPKRVGNTTSTIGPIELCQGASERTCGGTMLAKSWGEVPLRVETNRSCGNDTLIPSSRVNQHIVQW